MPGGQACASSTGSLVGVVVAAVAGAALTILAWGDFKARRRDLQPGRRRFRGRLRQSRGADRPPRAQPDRLAAADRGRRPGDPEPVLHYAIAGILPIPGALPAPGWSARWPNAPFSRSRWRGSLCCCSSPPGGCPLLAGARPRYPTSWPPVLCWSPSLVTQAGGPPGTRRLHPHLPQPVRRQAVGPGPAGVPIYNFNGLTLLFVLFLGGGRYRWSPGTGLAVACCGGRSTGSH